MPFISQTVKDVIIKIYDYNLVSGNPDILSEMDALTAGIINLSKNLTVLLRKVRCIQLTKQRKFVQFTDSSISQPD